MYCTRHEADITESACLATILATEHGVDLVLCRTCDYGKRLAATCPIPPHTPAAYPAKMRVIGQVLHYAIERFPSHARHGFEWLYVIATGEFCMRRVSREDFEARCRQAGLLLETMKRKLYVRIDARARELANAEYQSC